MPRCYTCLFHSEPSIVRHVKDGDRLPYIREAGGGFAGLRLALIHGEAIEYSPLLIARIGSEAATPRGVGAEVVANGLDVAQ